MIIGLTGGIGCGKSTALSIFRDLGCHTLNTDEVVAQIYRDDEEVRHKLVEAFGSGILSASGSIDKRSLVRLLKNPATAQRLNGIVHPAVRAFTRRTYEKLLQNEENPLLVVEAPLLHEAGSAAFYDLVVCITCPREVGLERFAAARGLSVEEAAIRADRQLPTPEKARRSDYVISNEGTLNELREKVEEILTQIRH